MSKYKFDFNIGHYVLNEADENTSNDTLNNLTNNSLTNTTNTNNNSEVSPLPVLNNEDVTNMMSAMTNDLLVIDKDLEKFDKNKVLLLDNIAKAMETYNSATDMEKEKARTEIIANNKKLLDLLLLIANKEKEKADKKYKHITAILSVQLKLNESLIRKIPEKYSYLNESNIHTAKIYMNNLVVNDEDEAHILKGMTDFKQAFGESNLLYGKDKEGYFVVCIDQEDFNRMYTALENVGYSRDIIIDNIMPQLFDRKDLIN